MGLLVEKESPEVLAASIIHYYAECCEGKFSQEIAKLAIGFG
jgi:hypothetical protein